MYVRALLFLFCLWPGLARSVQSYEKRSFSKYLISFGLFPGVFGQVNEWPLSKLHEMIRVLLLVACPILFILFYEQDWQGGVFKVMKNDHFSCF